MRKKGSKDKANEKKLFDYIKKIKLHATVNTKPNQRPNRDAMS
jgi:hypothetical protein